MRILTTLVLVLLAIAASAQTSQVTFGKNRVQYHNRFDEWFEYESDNFVTFWYGAGRNIGQSVVMMAEQEFASIQNILEHRMNEKVRLIVYADLTDLKQSNIGTDEVFTISNGQQAGRRQAYVSATETRFLGNKAFLYFNGDHNDLRRQVREGIASVYVDHMLYGSSVQEVVQNAVLLNLPAWFKQGLVAHIGESWNTEADDQLRQLMSSDRYSDFRNLATDYPRLAGHAFWYYVSEAFGETTVGSLLYLTRIHRSIDNGFLFALGSPYRTVLSNWAEFYRNRYNQDLQGRIDPSTLSQIEIRNRRGHHLGQVKMSPDGQRIAYVINDIGRVKVYIQDLQTGDRKLILRTGQRNMLQATDYGYPMLAFSSSNQELAVLYETRDQPKLLRYQLTTGDKIEEPLGPQLQRVHSMAYLNPGIMIMSAMRQGVTDLYYYYPATRESFPIFNDPYDDLDAMPVRIKGQEGVVFASNRPNTILQPVSLDTVLPVGQYDLFYYDLTNKPGELVRLTNTPLANERGPIPIDTTFFSYLSDESGIFNREIGRIEEYIHHYEQVITLEDETEIRMHADSSLSELDTSLIVDVQIVPVIKERGVTRPISNYNTNIAEQTAVAGLDKQLLLFRTSAGSVLTQVQLDTTVAISLSYTAFKRKSSVQTIETSAPPTTPAVPDQAINTPIEPAPAEAAPAELPDQYLFQTEFDEDVPLPPADASIRPGRNNTTPVNRSDRRPSSIDSNRVVVGAPQDPSPTINLNPVPSRPVNPNARGEREVRESGELYKFRPGTIIPYRLTFRVNYLTTTADNNPLFEGLNSFAANPNGFTQQPLGLLLKGNIMDLFEDHVIEGGLRIPTAFNGTEYFITYTNRKRRLDRTVSIYRRNRRRDEGTLSQSPRRISENTLLGQYGLRYPFDLFRSLRATFTLRRDRVLTLPTERSALGADPDEQQRIGARVEYVFDNTIDLAPNLRQGTRYKIYTDFYKGFTLGIRDGVDASFNDGFLGLVGADFRHYHRLDRRSILAFRVAGAYNFGSQNILYYLGGADNSLLQSFNQDIPTPSGNEFVFTDLANPLRGFDINARNGTTYILGNAEIRVPVFNYIFPRLRSSLLRNFQLVGFFDIGSAWLGDDPFSPDNPANIRFYPEQGQSENVTNTVRLRVVRFRDPVIYGYGFGIRTSLFGYFVRLDYGWGVETRVRGDGVLHLSLGYDF
ncbi:MAG: hypothetical protein AAGF87_13185 [Bacteroidota bacterium]